MQKRVKSLVNFRGGSVAGLRGCMLLLVSMFVFTSSYATLSIAYPDGERSNIEELVERRRWADAKLALQEYRRGLDPIKDRYEFEWVDYQLVCCHVELGSQEAEALMSAFMEHYPSSQYANRMLFMFGCYHCDNGNLELAEPLFDEVDYEALSALEKERYDIRLGYIRFTQGDYLSASSRFANISPKSPYYEHARYYLSYIDYHSYRYDLAKAGFESLAHSDSYRQVIPYYLLQIEYREQNFNYVISEGERLLATSTSDVRPDLVRIIAEAYFIQNDYAQALKYISMYPEDKYARQENYIKGYSLYRLARYEDAIEPLNSVCGANDHLTQNASYHLADCYLRVGDKSNAAKAFAMASVEGFDETIAENALLNQGRLVFELGGVMNESLNVLKQYLQRYPESIHCAEVQNLIVATYYNSSSYEAAYDIIKSIQNPSKDLRLALQKITVYRAVDEIAAGNYVLAGELLDESKSIGMSAKYKALTYYWMGELAMIKGEYDEAKRMYEDYIRCAPKSDNEYAMAHYGLGYAYFSNKEYDMASVAFDTYLRGFVFDDNGALRRSSKEYVAKDQERYIYDAQNRFGDSHFAQRHFDAARKAYGIASAYRDTNSPICHYANYQLAIIDGIKSKNATKIERLKDVVRGGSEYADDAWYEIGRTYISASEYEDGIRVLEDFVDNNLHSPYYIPALMNLGLGYYNLYMYDEARDKYKLVIEADPQSQTALEALRAIREIYVTRSDIDGYFEFANSCGVQSDMGIAARDSLTFTVARNEYLDGDINLAAVKLRTYLDEFEVGYNRTEALFYLSDCFIRIDDKEQALECMDELVSIGTNQYTERVLTVMAPMCFDMELYPKSADAYLKLYEVANDDSRRMWAVDGYVKSRLKYLADSEAITFVAELEAMECVKVETMRKAQIVKARALFTQGDDAAFDIFRQLAENRRTVEGAESYYRLVEQSYNRGDLAISEQMVYDMGEFGSVYWQAKCFIILGDIMRDKGNIFQARATYQSVVDGYTISDDGIVMEAQSRINSL